jgi:hypothetical protein
MLYRLEASEVVAGRNPPRTSCARTGCTAGCAHAPGVVSSMHISPETYIMNCQMLQMLHTAG